MSLAKKAVNKIVVLTLIIGMVLPYLTFVPTSWAITTPDLSKITMPNNTWQAPQTLPAPVNLDGWEDSVVTDYNDNNKIYFAYISIDIFNYLNDLIAAYQGGQNPDPQAYKNNYVIGSERPGSHGILNSEIYEATYNGGSWQVINSSVNDNTPGSIIEQHSPSVPISNDVMYLQRTTVGQYGDIYKSIKNAQGQWSAPVIESALSKPDPIDDGDPHVSADGNTIFFDSNRSGGKGDKDLWSSTKNGNGQWSTPQPITALNTKFTEWQPFITKDGNTLYFTSNTSDGVNPSKLSIFKSEYSNGSWGPRQLVVKIDDTSTNIVALGEPSISANNDKLYFLYVRIRDDGFYESNIAMARIAENIKPSVSIIGPSSSSSLRGAVRIKANATDNVGISKVEFYIDNKLTKTVSSPPYEYNWDTTVLPDGSHSIKVKAFDFSNNSNESLINVNTSNNNAPVLNKISDIEVKEGKVITITPTATDADKNLLSYSVANLPSGATFAGNTFTWTPNYNQAGRYNVTFKVSDKKLTDETTVTITVKNTDVTPPTTFSLASLSKKLFRYNSTLRWSASSDFESGLNRYELYVDNVLNRTLSSNTTLTKLSFNLGNGLHSYYVAAVDNAGNRIMTASQTFQIDNYKPKTYARNTSARRISRKKSPRYLKLYRHYRGKYKRTHNRTLKKRYYNATKKYHRLYNDARKSIATAKLRWYVKDQYTGNRAYVTLKIQKKIKSRSRVKKKARYLRIYRKYRAKHLAYKNKYRKTRNRTLRRRYQRTATRYKKAMRKYLRAYRRTKTVVYKTVKAPNYRWTSINKWRTYTYRTRSRGIYRYLVYAKDKAGNNQHNIAKNFLVIR